MGWHRRRRRRRRGFIPSLLPFTPTTARLPCQCPSSLPRATFHILPKRKQTLSTFHRPNTLPPSLRVILASYSAGTEASHTCLRASVRRRDVESCPSSRVACGREERREGVDEVVLEWHATTWGGPCPPTTESTGGGRSRFWSALIPYAAHPSLRRYARPLPHPRRPHCLSGTQRLIMHRLGNARAR